MSQNRLVDALGLAGVPAELVYPSRFATNREELFQREQANQAIGPGMERYEAVLGIDGEGWLWAAQPHAQPFVAFCEAVLVEVLPFETLVSAALLRRQSEWEGAAARSAEAVVARSEFAARRVAEAYDVPRERITVLPIPFDLDDWRASLPLLPKQSIVLAVGHTYPRKNYRTLLQAWPTVKAARRNAVLAIVGTGPDSAELQEMAAGMAGVRLLGHVAYHDLLSLYARASVFCHPSLQENFGIAVVEGLACGASLVVHQHPAVLENVEGLHGVWPMDASDPEALAHAIIVGLTAKVPWRDTRLDQLRHKLNPLRVGQQLRSLLAPLIQRR